jgi:glycosyltransferase involved in cell wall biosynthesis
MVDMHRCHIDGDVEYVPLGIDLAGAPGQLPRRPRTPLRFGFIGGFQRNKGVLDVLDAAIHLKQRQLAFELHVWGPGQEQGRGEVAARYLDDCVFLRGMFTTEQRWTVYNEIDVAIMATTVSEPFGRVPMEAAAAGAPTIAPAIGGILETVRDGENGLLYRFGDKNDLQRQMQRILDEPELFHRLTRQLVRPPNSKETAATLESFYVRMIGRATKGHVEGEQATGVLS